MSLTQSDALGIGFLVFQTVFLRISNAKLTIITNLVNLLPIILENKRLKRLCRLVIIVS